MNSKRSQVSPRTVWTIGLNIVAMVAILLLIYVARDVLILVLAALILTGAVNPIIIRLEQRGWKRGIAVLAFFALLQVSSSSLTSRWRTIFSSLWFSVERLR